MALTWDVTKIENHEEVTTWVPDHDDPNGRYKAGDRMWHPVTEALVMASLDTGIGTITAENAGEVFARITLVERLYGPRLIRAEVDGVRPRGEAAFITREEVAAHIGLRTNVGAMESRASFLKRHVVWFLDDEKKRFERYAPKEVVA